MNYYPNFNNQYYMQDLQQMRDRIDQQMRQAQQMQSQPMQQPIQNIINTNGNSIVEFEARYLKENENPADLIVQRKTAFIDLKNGRLSIKDLDGNITEYPIILPKDEKDLKIEQLENTIKRMEAKFNELSINNESISQIEQQTSNVGKPSKK